MRILQGRLVPPIFEDGGLFLYGRLGGTFATLLQTSHTGSQVRTSNHKG